MKVRKNRVAVISKNTAVVEFFQLEAQSCGCPISVMEEPPATLRDFERVILDASVGSCVSDHANCLVAAVLTDDKTVLSIAPDEIWEWPISVETVRAFLESSGDIRFAERSVDRSMIYLLSHERKELLYCNRKIALTPHEWQILLALGKCEGVAVSRDSLRRILGDWQGNMTDVYIHRLRKKLEDFSGVRLIRTVRGKGYLLEAKLSDQSKNT